MQVTVHVKPEVARRLHAGEHDVPDAKEIAEITRDLGVSLDPIHPGSDDPQLVGAFAVRVPDAATAEQVIHRIRECGAVEAAYVKPPEAAP